MLFSVKSDDRPRGASARNAVVYLRIVYIGSTEALESSHLMFVSQWNILWIGIHIETHIIMTSITINTKLFDLYECIDAYMLQTINTNLIIAWNSNINFRSHIIYKHRLPVSFLSRRSEQKRWFSVSCSILEHIRGLVWLWTWPWHCQRCRRGSAKLRPQYCHCLS